MEVVVYILMCVPAVLMTVAGIVISSAKRDSTMINHHHARNFNINKYSKKIITLFTVTGIIFSLGGIVLVSNHLIAGILIMFAALLAFIISFASLQK